MIRTVVEDDHYDPDPAVLNTEDLITQRHVFFLFDYVGTPTLTRVLPLLKYYEDAQIVDVAPLTGADAQRKPPYDRYVFNIRASYRDEAQALVDYFYRQGYRRIGYFGQSDSYGKSGEVATAAALAKYGLKIAESVSYSRGTTFDADFRQQVEILRSSGVDAIVSFGVYGACAGFIRDVRLTGWQVPIANVSFAGSDELLKELIASSRRLNRDLTSALITSEVVPSPSQFEYPLVAKFGAVVSPESRNFVALEGWLNATVVCEALKRMRPNGSRGDFVAAMESLGGWDPGLGLKLTFSPSCHQGLHQVWLLRAGPAGWIPLNPAATK